VPAVADRVDDVELESELEIVPSSDPPEEFEVEADVEATEPVAALTAMFAPSPRRVATLSAPAKTRDRAAAWRRRRRRPEPAPAARWAGVPGDLDIGIGRGSVPTGAPLLPFGSEDKDAGEA
jgi:hypothetical protein